MPIKSLSITLLLFLAFTADVSAQKNQSSARFDKLKRAIFAQPYLELPTYIVNRENFGKSGKGEDNVLLREARRTLVDDRDLIEFSQGQKLLQANGVCFTAQWTIDKESGFTGLFAKGASSLAIVRASVSLSGTLQKDKRAFGMAIKLLPENLGEIPSLNIFVLNSMGGAISKHVLDLAMDNQPSLGRIPRWSDIPTALRLRKDLEQADRDAGAVKPQVAFRPITHLASFPAQASVSSPNVSSPKWVRLSAKSEQRVDKDDFRNEMRIENYPSGNITYRIEVAADNEGAKAKASWQEIGRLVLQESITSKACDTKLHFKHPKLKAGNDS